MSTIISAMKSQLVGMVTHDLAVDDSEQKKAASIMCVSKADPPNVAIQIQGGLPMLFAR